MSIPLTYTEPPERLRDEAGGFAPIGPDPDRLAQLPALTDKLKSIEPPTPNHDGDIEWLGTVPAVHRFVDAPGDSETVRWHFVECGPPDADTVIFLHGVPDSWWQWHHVMEALAHTRRCIAVDLKGYGQSDKRTGDYRQAGVATQLIALFDELGVDQFSLVAHDRGTPPADHIVARLGERITRYGRGQQHLWHLNPALHPQESMFTSPEVYNLLADAPAFVATAYTALTAHDVAFEDLHRTVEEFSHPGIASAVPRYFHSSSFRQEWVDRRTELIRNWRSPVLLLQAAHDALQPREFYSDPGVLKQLPSGSDVHFFDAGHFWPFEAVKETVDVITEFV
jgi:pimeloyl-ACP methyl ester carboxylesterase